MAASVAEPSCEVDKLSYEIFSILESKFLFGLTEKVAGETPAAGERLGRGKVRVLCIDGGTGPGGVVSAKALSYLEAALRRKSGNPDARIADYVDVAAGSGVGGLLASMLFTRSGDSGRPLFHAENTWKLLVDKARDLFPRRSGMLRRLCGRSPGSRFDRVLKSLFGDSTLRDTLKPVLVPCYDLSSSAPFLFSRADAMETDGYNFRIRDVCRAAVADPALGRPVELRSLDGRTRCVGVDGGIVMNNPTAAAITHVLNNKQEFPFVAGVEDLIVLSLGSGESSDYDTCSRNPAPRASQLIKIAGDGVSDLVNYRNALYFLPNENASCAIFPLSQTSIKTKTTLPLLPFLKLLVPMCRQDNIFKCKERKVNSDTRELDMTDFVGRVKLFSTTSSRSLTEKRQ